MIWLVALVLATNHPSRIRGIESEDMKSLDQRRRDPIVSPCRRMRRRVDGTRYIERQEVSPVGATRLIDLGGANANFEGHTGARRPENAALSRPRFLPRSQCNETTRGHRLFRHPSLNEAVCVDRRLAILKDRCKR